MGFTAIPRNVWAILKSQGACKNMVWQALKLVSDVIGWEALRGCRGGFTAS
jgi:hypothetical protein